MSRKHEYRQRKVLLASRSFLIPIRGRHTESSCKICLWCAGSVVSTTPEFLSLLMLGHGLSLGEYCKAIARGGHLHGHKAFLIILSGFPATIVAATQYKDIDLIYFSSGRTKSGHSSAGTRRISGSQFGVPTDEKYEVKESRYARMSSKRSASVQGLMKL